MRIEKNQQIQFAQNQFISPPPRPNSFKRSPSAGRLNSVGKASEWSSPSGRTGHYQRRTDRTDNLNVRRKWLIIWFFRVLLILAAVLFMLGTFMQGSMPSVTGGVETEVAPRPWERSRPGRNIFTDSPVVHNRLAFLRQSVGLQEIPSLVEVAGRRERVRPPRVALVCPTLIQNPDGLYLLTVAKGLHALGYVIEVLSIKGGSLLKVWQAMGATVRILCAGEGTKLTPVNWFRFDAVIGSSVDIKPAVMGLSERPFNEVPFFWLLHDDRLARHLELYNQEGVVQLVKIWKQIFKGPHLVILTSPSLQDSYHYLDQANHIIVPASPAWAWTAELYAATHTRTAVRLALGLGERTFCVAVVSSPRAYRKMWREHAMVLQAVASASKRMRRAAARTGGAAMLAAARAIRVLVLGPEPAASGYPTALQALAGHLGLNNATTVHVGIDGDREGALWAADVVVYSSVQDASCLTPELVKAMALGRLVVTPSLPAVLEEIKNGTNGIMYTPGDQLGLSKILQQVMNAQPGEIEELGSAARRTAHKIGAARVVLEHAKLLEEFLQFGPDVVPPWPVQHLASMRQLADWGWAPDSIQEGERQSNDGMVEGEDVGDEEELLMEGNLNRQRDSRHGLGVERQVLDDRNSDRWPEQEPQTSEGRRLDPVMQWLKAAPEDVQLAKGGYLPDAVKMEEDRWHRQNQKRANSEVLMEEMDPFEGDDTWEQEDQQEAELQALEEDELAGRDGQRHSTWEEVLHAVKRAEREGLHERDEGELERTGQALVIYEPFLGAGAWPFLHTRHSLYRGISLSSEGKREGLDDVDASLRLPLLKEQYYQQVMCELGTFLAIGSRIDRLHRSPWIGMQWWRGTAEKLDLSAEAEAVMLKEIETGGKGDVIYFWVATQSRPGTSFNTSDGANLEDFWATCDALNNGQCRSVFLEAMKEMYGLPSHWSELPPMPLDGGTWPAMHSWILPTPSFVEFVLFARMFVDALDTRFFEQHSKKGICPLASTRWEAKYCYCRLLERLIGVWAYHSRRQLVHVNATTGQLTEHHPLAERVGSAGRPWRKWFSKAVLKGMDEDRAEEVDEEHPTRRWLWPRTGEVSWAGSVEKERQERLRQKAEKARRRKERQARRSKYKQRALGRQYKPRSSLDKKPTTFSGSKIDLKQA